MSRVRTISPQCITEIDPKKDYLVYILDGSPEALCSERCLVNKYETNRLIKYISDYYLLKALTTSGIIQNWRSQRQLVLSWLQMNEPTFYNHVKQLRQLGLLTVDRHFNITLVSYRKAAEILNIPYAGTTGIPYNPFKHEAKQSFQYFLRVEEFRTRKEDQLNGLMYNLDKNPLLKNDLAWLMVHQGANPERLATDPDYYQQRLLRLQINSFRHGSEILEYIFTRRADIERSVNRIKEDHHYKSARSVSYLKKKLRELKLVNIEKVCVKSLKRVRIYVPDATKKKGARDGYKWLLKAKETAWFLCDQISIIYQPQKAFRRHESEKKAA